MNTVVDLLPMPVGMGPPLPRTLNVRWSGTYDLIAEGNKYNLDQVSNFEGQYEEGDRGYIDLQLLHSAAADAVVWLDNLLGERLPEHQLVTRGSHVEIYFEKGIAPLAIIAMAIATVIIIWGLIIAWRLYKETSGEVFPLFIIPVIGGLIAAGTFVLMKVLGKR